MKNPIAVELGRLGGQARAEKLKAGELTVKKRARRGRPKKKCPCGKFTLARAKQRGHKCAVVLEQEFVVTEQGAK